MRTGCLNTLEYLRECLSFELSTVFFFGGGGCAIHQAVIHRPLTSEARRQSQAIVCEICVSVTLGQVSSEYFGFSLLSLIPT